MGLLEPHGRHRRRHGGFALSMGRVAGIARHECALGPIERLDTVAVSAGRGLEGDFRGTMKPGADGGRGVSLIEARDWADATAETGCLLPWWERRANLLVEDFDLPQAGGVRLRIGAAVVLEISQECAPCARMEALAPGLRAALTPDWRAGALAKVIVGGSISVGDPIEIEPAS
jgi:MOSC domain-containing protein YiiM